MTKLAAITIADVNIGERLRPVDTEQAKALAFTIGRHGLINPITVRSTPAAKAGKFTLVAGAHRLEACRLLGWEQIEAIVVKANSDEAEVLEIAENFFRNDLSAIDRAAFGERFRELWEKNVGPINSRKRREVGANLAPIFQGQFKDAVAKRLGVSPSAAKRLHRIATGIHPELRSILRGEPYADKESFLLKLAKLPADDQLRIAASLKEKPDLKLALSWLKEEGRKGYSRMEPSEYREENFRKAWEALPKDCRAAALASIGAMLKPVEAWPSHLPPVRVAPAKGNASPLWGAVADPAALRQHVSIEEIRRAKEQEASRDCAEEINVRRYDIVETINEAEKARREEHKAEVARYTASRSRKPKRGRPADTPEVKAAKQLVRQLAKKGCLAELADRLVNVLEVDKTFWIAKEAHKLTEEEQRDLVRWIDDGDDLEEASDRVMKMLERQEPARMAS